jgi:hypothetical protein
MTERRCYAELQNALYACSTREDVHRERDSRNYVGICGLAAPGYTVAPTGHGCLRLGFV